MILDTTGKSLQIVLGEAKTTNDCDITACWSEETIGTFLLQSGDLVSNGTSPVTVVTAPPQKLTTRNVKEIRLHNNDTVPHKVTLQLNNGGAVRIVLFNPALPPGGDFVYTPDAGATASSGGSGTVTDVVAGAGINVGAGPGGSITNAGTLNLAPATTAAIGGVVIGSGVTVNAGGTISTSGGGGGSYSAGLGLVFSGSSPTTINNTGTIVQPASTGTTDIGVLFVTGGITNAGTPTAAVGSNAAIAANGISITNAAGTGSAGTGVLGGGNAYGVGVSSTGASIYATGGTIHGTVALGGIFNMRGGNGENGQAGHLYAYGGIGYGAAGIGGDARIKGGAGTNQGGNVLLQPGSGATNGVLLVSNIGTVNPHVLGAVFQSATANIAGYYPLYRSQG